MTASKRLDTVTKKQKNDAVTAVKGKKQKIEEIINEQSEQDYSDEYSSFDSNEDDEFSNLEEDDCEDEEGKECSDLEEFEEDEESGEKMQMFSDDEDELEGEEEEGSDEYDPELYSDSDKEESHDDQNEPSEQDGVELDQEDPSTLSPTVLRDRIHSTLKLLTNWKSLHSTLSPPKSRSQVLEAWYTDIATYYSYSIYMVEKLAALFGCEEALQFFEANEQARPVTLRVNTLKTRKRDLVQALTARGVTIESLGTWTPVGLQVFDSSVPIGATPEYLAGHYLLQAGSSLLPVQALDPQPNDRVLDMSAAPGGKSTHLAALMRNTGVLFANDASRDRLKALVANIHRMGVRNSVVCNYDGRKLPGVLGLNSFQRILLDAPCSGTGVISKDPTVKASKTDADFDTLTHLQKELILAAADMCEAGGFFVYSTCSVTVEENEEVVAYALSKRKNLRLVDTGIPFGREGFTAFRGKQFPQSLKLTRRFYPHMHNMDGFFVSKFEKIKQ